MNLQNISTTKTNTYPSYTMTCFLFLASYLCVFNVLDGPSVLCGPKVANALAFEWFSSVQEMKFLERGSFPSNTLCGLSVTFLSSKKAASDIWIWRFLRTSLSNSARMLRTCFFPFFHVIISLTAKRFVDGWRYCTGMLERFYHQNNFSCRGIPSWYFLLRPRLWFSKVWREEVGQLSPLSIQLCLLLWGATGFGQQAETTNSFCAGSPAAVTLQCLSVITGRGRIWSSGGEAKSLCLPLLNILFKCRPWSHFLTLLRPGKGLKYDHYSLKQLGRDMPFYSLGSVFFSHLLQLSREP